MKLSSLIYAIKLEKKKSVVATLKTFNYCNSFGYTFVYYDNNTRRLKHNVE